MTTCKRCNRPLRYKGEPLDENPGSVLHAARGLCKSCCIKSAQDGTLENYATLPKHNGAWVPRNCPDCNRALRPYHGLLADFPDTVSMYGQGRCKRCFEAMGHNGPARQAHERSTVETNKANLEAWHARKSLLARRTIRRNALV